MQWCDTFFMSIIWISEAEAICLIVNKTCRPCWPALSAFKFSVRRRAKNISSAPATHKCGVGFRLMDFIRGAACRGRILCCERVGVEKRDWLALSTLVVMLIKWQNGYRGDARRRTRKKWNNYDAFNERASARDTRTPLFALLLAKLRHKKWRRTLLASSNGRSSSDKQTTPACAQNSNPQRSGCEMQFLLITVRPLPGANNLAARHDHQEGPLLDDAYFGNFADIHYKRKEFDFENEVTPSA
jgi:hypothetical protein